MENKENYLWELLDWFIIANVTGMGLVTGASIIVYISRSIYFWLN